MALAYWILCRCKECAKLSYFKADGEKVIGREWNRNSSTYKRHTQTHAAKPPASRPDAHDRGALSKKKHVGNRAARTVSRTARAQVPQEIRKPRPSGLSKTDPKATFWTGKTVSCGKYTALNDYFTRIAHPKCQARVLLAACQYFFLHLSSEAINSTLACLKCMVLDSKIPPQQLYLPSDIRKIIQDLCLDPEIKRTICCPRCFHLYPVDDPPHACTARATRRSRKCLEPLYKSPSSPQVRRYFSTQSFTDWLARFLSRPGIEDLIDKSVSATPDGASLSDIWDSNMWKTLKTSDGQRFTSDPGNLVFSLNVDWFNPSGNKSAGKHISLGTVALMCLNLPPHLRASHDNIFLAGLTPGPTEPTVTQINHVLEPLVTELKELWTGIKFNSTFNFPKGRIIKVMLGPIICDLPAIRKVLGMAGHSSYKNMCSFCRVTKGKIDRVDLNQIRPRKPQVLREQANNWKNAITLADRKEIFTTYGVRYTILFELPYFDPLANAIIEPMHNIFLGLLKHHGQKLFGLKSSEKKLSKNTRFNPKATDSASGSEQDDSEDSAMADLEDSACVEEETAGKGEQQADQLDELLGALQSFRFDSDSEPAPELQSSSSESDAPRDQSFPDNEIPSELNPLGAKFFSKDNYLKVLREVNTQFTLPSWIGRVPSTIGSAKGGKLKADEWVILFEIIMIPALVRILFETSSDTFQIGVFQNLLHLTSVTNIVRALEITTDDIEALRFHLTAYRQGLLEIFPSFPTMPNHHYALHLPDCLLQFGLAPQWTAWSFERLNGALASIPTNNHIKSRDLTLLRRWVTAQNFRNHLPLFCQNLPAQTS
ncbi:hypothetical protein MJO29_006614 [Puccinia striiformis f. sp. tritici]|nr:hypothetical protein MJO29_006614 [Puccinia striiformis f. sp. tritici]